MTFCCDVLVCLEMSEKLNPWASMIWLPKQDLKHAWHDRYISVKGELSQGVHPLQNLQRTKESWEAQENSITWERSAQLVGYPIPRGQPWICSHTNSIRTQQIAFIYLAIYTSEVTWEGRRKERKWDKFTNLVSFPKVKKEY